MLWFLYEHTYWFILLFFIVVLSLSIFSLVLFRKSYSFESIIDLKNNNSFNKINLGYLFLFSLAISIYITMIPMWEHFTYQDNIIFSGTLLNGEQWFRPPVWPAVGRLFPLAHQEWEFIAIISASNFAYHMFAVIEVLLFCFIMIKIFNNYTSLIVSLLLLASPQFVQSFFGLIYPERNMIIFLSLIILSMIIHMKTGSLFNVVLLSLEVCAFLFYKETSFLILYGLSASSLLYFLMFRDTKAITLTIITFVSASLWLAIYIFCIVPETQKMYGGGFASILHVLTQIITSPITYLSIVSLLLFIFNIKMKSIFSLMPIIAIGYSFTMYMLKFDMPYYHAPSMLIAVLSIFISSKNKVWVAYIVCILSTIFTFNDSISIIKDRKEIVTSKADVAQYIATISKINNLKNISISFIGSDSYENMIFYSYIENKYKIKVTPSLNQKCSTGVNFVINFGHKIDEKGFFTYKTEDVPMWKNNYNVYAINCHK